MAIEVLIRLKDGTGGRQSGDIVSLKVTPHNGWGKEEGLPNYAVINIPVDKEIFLPYHVRHDRFVDLDRIIWQRRSKYRVDLNLLKLSIRTALLTNGYYEITKLTDVTGALVLKDYLNVGIEPVETIIADG